MRVEFKTLRRNRSRSGGFTLVEVAISVAIAGLSIGGIVWGYIMAANRVEWSMCSSAAQAMAMRHLEQTKSARWDTLTDELVQANFPGATENLDLPVAGSGSVNGTNTITIVDVSGSDPPLRTVRVDCSWSLMSHGPFTNTVFALRFQEQ